MSNHHTDDPECPLCEEKLSQAHPYLSDWFKKSVKTKSQDAHVSWSYRGEDDQNKAFDSGASRLKYPLSAHNHTENGKPTSYAIDLFQIANGKAFWSSKFFYDLNEDIESNNLSIFWGGKWKELGDADHFQYRSE